MSLKHDGSGRKSRILGSRWRARSSRATPRASSSSSTSVSIPTAGSADRRQRHGWPVSDLSMLSANACRPYLRPSATGPRGLPQVVTGISFRTGAQSHARTSLRPRPGRRTVDLCPFALNIEQSLTGQPWRWRRSAEPLEGMDSLVDELLLARGVARDDLRAPPRSANPRLPARPVLLPGHGQRRQAARRRGRGGETITIFGDYDVDGATSAALLTLLLRGLGAEPMVYIPDRLMEGYGPSGEALVELKARGASLALTRRLRRAGVRGA